jgi:hypothetical protein
MVLYFHLMMNLLHLMMIMNMIKKVDYDLIQVELKVKVNHFQFDLNLNLKSVFEVLILLE